MKRKLSYSTAKKLLRQLPEQAVYNIDNPFDPTPAMMMGTNIELAFQEGLDNFVVYPGKVRRGKEWEAFQRKNEGVHIVTNAEFDKISGAVYSLEKQVPWLKEMNYQSHVEGTVKGVHVHGYCDWDNEDSIFDLKVTDCTEREFMRSISRFDYHIQAAVYHHCTGKTFYWVCVHPDMPHPVRVYKASEAMICVGMNELEKAADLFVKYQNNTLITTDTEPVELEPYTWMIERSNDED